jgi:hypothetical protein
VAQVVEFLPSKHEALNSNPVPQKKKKKKQTKKMLNEQNPTQKKKKKPS